ncbi:hypothetical protein PFISCL1PPCAC_14513, partial [Pristionchus fissidentatus]
HCIFVASSILNAISLLCLLKRTPPNQSTIRKYFIVIQILFQVLMIINDVNLEIFFQPIPLFPLIAGYCLGLLCKAGVPFRMEANITILINTYIGIAIMLCVFYRHQTLLVASSPVKFRPV